MAEDAAQRQEETRFGAGDSGGVDGAGDSAGPPHNHGDTRHEAAKLVTQKASYSRLEHIGWIEEVAADESQPERIRELASRELETIRTTGKVDASYQRVKGAIELLKLVPTTPAGDRARDPGDGVAGERGAGSSSCRQGPSYAGEQGQAGLPQPGAAHDPLLRADLA